MKNTRFSSQAINLETEITHDTRPKRIKIRNICGDETIAEVPK
jgi:hypothetical protein